MRAKLTDLSIRQLSAPQSTAYVWDASLPGFGIRVSPKGLKTFTVQYGKQRLRKTLGHWPAVSLQAARSRAKSILAHPLDNPPSCTLSEALEDYLRGYIHPNYRPRAAKEVERLLRKYAPLHLKLSDLAAHRLVYPAAPSEANHFFSAMRTFLAWCERSNLITHSPYSKLRKPHKENARQRLITDAEFIRIWMHAGSGQFARIIRLCFVLGQRRTALSTIQRSWIEGDAILFPAHTMKNNREHWHPLGPLSKALLAEYSFNGSHNSWSQPKAGLDKRSSVTDWTIHDTRRFYSSAHARLGTPIDVQEALLAHSTGSRSPLQRVYDMYDRREPMRNAQLTYENHLLSLLAAHNLSPLMG